MSACMRPARRPKSWFSLLSSAGGCGNRGVRPNRERDTHLLLLLCLFVLALLLLRLLLLVLLLLLHALGRRQYLLTLCPRLLAVGRRRARGSRGRCVFDRLGLCGERNLSKLYAHESKNDHRKWKNKESRAQSTAEQEKGNQARESEKTDRQERIERETEEEREQGHCLLGRCLSLFERRFEPHLALRIVRTQLRSKSGGEKVGERETGETESAEGGEEREERNGTIATLGNRPH